MIKGIVHNNRPLIPVIVGWTLGVQELIALVDTGFTGELKVSPDTATELGLEITHAEPVSLGNDQVVNMSASLALVSMEGTKNVVNVLISQGKPIIGVSLLRKFGYTLTIDFKFNALELRSTST